MSDGNLDGVEEFISAVITNQPIWPNKWGQDVAYVAFRLHVAEKMVDELLARVKELEGKNNG